MLFAHFTKSKPSNISMLSITNIFKRDRDNGQDASRNLSGKKIAFCYICILHVFVYSFIYILVFNLILKCKMSLNDDSANYLFFLQGTMICGWDKRVSNMQKRAISYY